MSYVVAAPEFVVAAAHDLATIGSNLSVANAAALFPTSGVMAPGADEVSATIAALFGAHAQAYQALSAQAALFHQQFVQLMNGGAAEYAFTEAANASPLDAVQQGALGATPAASVSSGVPSAGMTPASTPAATVPRAAAALTAPAALTQQTLAPSVAAVQTAAAPSLAGAMPAAFAPGAPIGASAAAAAEPAALGAGPVEAVEAESADFAPSPASALPLASGTPLAAAPTSRAFTPATPAYSPEAYSPAPAPVEEQPAG